jgi:autotransporter-associated beta strand protein
MRLILSPRRATILLVFCAVHCFGLGASAARAAAVYSWADAGATWGDASNWGGTEPGSVDIGAFGSASYIFQPNLSAAAAVGGIWDTGAGGLTIGGSTLTLQAALINGNYATGIEMDPGAGAVTITAPVALKGSQTWVNNASTLLVQGNVALNGYGLTIAGSGNTSISGAISGPYPNGLTMIGTGDLQLSGSNTFTGQTIVDGGTLQLTAGSLASLTQYAGYNSSGVIAQSGGVNAGSTLYLAYSPGSSGSYNLSSGLLATPNQQVGWANAGAFAQSGGTNSFTNQVQLGNGPGAVGAYNLTSGVVTGNEVDVGVSGSGSFAQSGGAVSLNALGLGLGSGYGSYNMSDGSITAVDEEIGYIGNGTFSQSGGVNTFNSGVVDLGNAGSGAYNLTGGQVTGYQINIGLSGNGSFVQSGGVVTVTATANAINLGSLNLGVTGGNGFYILNDGLLAAADEEVGYASNGVFTQSGGTNSFLTGTGGTVTGGYMNLGFAGSGTYNFNGGQIFGFETNIGVFGNGSFTQSDGLAVNYNALVVGFAPGGSGAYTLSGGTTATQLLVVANSGNGVFTQTGGLISINEFDVSDSTNTVGTYNLSGSGSLQSTYLIVGAFGSGSVNQSGGAVSVAQQVIGYDANGIFTQTAGTNSSTYDIQLGFNAGAIGTYNMAAGQLMGTEMDVGYSGSGAFNHSGGSVNLSSGLYIGGLTGAAGTYNLSGSGYLESTSPEYIGYAGNGSFTQSGGTNLADSGVQLGANAGSFGTYNLNGGLLVLGNNVTGGSGAASFNFGGGTIDAGSFIEMSLPVTLTTAGSSGTFDTDGNTLFFAAAITGPGGLILTDSGGGMLVLSASDGYRGGTTISSGLLELGTSASLGSGGLVVNGGTLDLSGFAVHVTSLRGAAGTITTSGGSSAGLIVVPSGTGTTTFAGNIQNGGGKVAFLMDGAGKLVLSGSNTYTGGTTVESGTLVIANAYSIKSGTKLIVGNPLRFSDVTPAAVATADAQAGPLAVPEPGTLLLLTAGSCLLASMRLRGRPTRKNAAARP